MISILTSWVLLSFTLKLEKIFFEKKVFAFFKKKFKKYAIVPEIID